MMHPDQLIGYHSEWNLVCPGGYDYQRMAQERGKLCWDRIKKVSGIEMELDFDHPLLKPVSSFLDMLLRAHRRRFRREKPFILLVAEKDTLDKVPENINVVKDLNRLEGVTAALTCPEQLEKLANQVAYLGRAATVIFLDLKNEKVILKHWQTDFRCLITDGGLIGFAARFGGIPTNVGSGGGNQSVAVLNSDIQVRDAVNRINEAIIGLEYATLMEIREETDQKGLELGHSYLTGPTPITLRPRIVTNNHLAALQEYSAHLWRDLLTLERMWIQGKLDHVVELDDGPAEIARMQPWEGSQALIASDGLFSFGADLINERRHS